MKKKLEVCPIHGLVLHRHKTQCWKKAGSDRATRQTTVKCFRCLYK